MEKMDKMITPKRTSRVEINNDKEIDQVTKISNGNQEYLEWDITPYGYTIVL